MHPDCVTSAHAAQPETVVAHVILVLRCGEIPDLVDVLAGGLAIEHHPSTIFVDVGGEVRVDKQDDSQESGQER